MHALFLHGALGCKRHWEPFVDAISKKYTKHLIDFEGHGSNLLSENLSFSDLVEQVKTYICEHQINDFIIVGYSLGGYVGLQLTEEKIPGLKKLICIATQLDWNEEKAAIENNKINTDSLLPIKEKLALEHLIGFESIINLTHDIIKSIGKKPIKSTDLIDNQTSIYFLVGERDKMVSKEFTQNFISKIPNTSIEIMLNQPHLLEKMDVEILTDCINTVL